MTEIKTKSEKTNTFFSLPAILLLAAIIVTSCSGAFGDLTSNNDFSENQVPEGLGYIKLKIGNTVERTVLPDTSRIKLENFAKFDVIITGAGASLGTTYEKLNANLALPVEVFPGTYTVTVLAYPNAGAATVATAAGQATGVTVAPGAGGTAGIILKEIVDGLGKGTFSWNLTIPPAPENTYDSALMDIISLRTRATVLADRINILSQNKDQKELDSGYYRVELSLEQGGRKGIKVIEILHVYQGMESDWIETLPVLKRNLYTVRFYYGDGRTPDPAVINVTHGDPVPKPSYPTHYLRPETNLFDAWYTDNTFTNKYDFDNGLLDDLDLYAKWLSADNLDGDVVLIRSDDKSPYLSGHVDVADQGLTLVISISVYNTADYKPNSYVWIVNGDSRTETGPSIQYSINVLSLYLLNGVNEINVTATDNDNVPHETTVKITVNMNP